MKTIGLYVVVGFSGIIFVTADEQGDVGCDFRAFLSACCSDDINIIHNNNTIYKICSACIGRSCRPKCPRGYYGEQCDAICTCDADACDDVSGCVTTEMKTIALYVVVGLSEIIFVTADEQGDVGCDHRAFLSTCCRNNIDIIHNNNTINKICSACFGRLCRPECPQGYYGEQCNETCTCDADICDDVFGCITTEETSTSVDEKSTDEQHGKPTGMVLKLSLSASLFIIIVLLVVLLCVVYRARKNNTGYPTVFTERNAPNVEDITRDSPVIYAAVVRPNRKPVRGVEQSDQMYGNTLKLPKPNQKRKKKARKSKFNTSNNATNEEGVKNGTPATYSFVKHPNKTSPLDVRNPDRASSLNVRHHSRTTSSDEGQYDLEYGNMTMLVGEPRRIFV